MIKTNIQWLPEIPEDWKIGKVQEAFKLSKNLITQENPTVLSLARDGIKERDISNNEGQLAASYDGYNEVLPGDLLLNPMDLVSGANCNMSTISGIISPAYLNLRARSGVFPKYFDYYFKTQYWTMAMFAHGKGVSYDHRWTINRNTILNYEIPIPSFDEQKRIADFLDDRIGKIDSLIENENKQFETLERLKKSVIQDSIKSAITANGYTEVPLKSLFAFGKGLPITKSNLLPSGVKVVSYGQLHAKYNKSYTLEPSLYRFVSESYLQSNPDSLVKKHDFIVADTSEDLQGTGDFVHVDNDDQIFAGYHSIILSSKNDEDSYFLSFLFMTDEWRLQLRSRVYGVKLYSLTKKILSQAQVPLPPKKKQEEVAKSISRRCDLIDSAKASTQKEIKKLGEYKKSLIYEYVTGKRRLPS